MPGDDQKGDQPPRSKHAGELYRFQAAWWQKLPGYVLTAIYFIGFMELGGHLLAGSGRRGSTVLGVVFIVIGIVGAYALWHVIASRVVVTEQGIKIRNHLRNYHLSWDEIDGYEAADHYYLRLAGGDRIRLYGLAQGLAATARTEREAACLKAEIERHKQAPAADPVGATRRS